MPNPDWRQHNTGSALQPQTQNSSAPPQYEYPPGQGPEQNPYQQPYTGSGGYNPNDPYDPRIGNGPLPQGIQGTQNRAYTRTVQGNELVANQLSALLDGDSAYMNNARREGLEIAARRGLLNSSMAAGSSQREAIRAGAPIAMQDASTYANTASENMGALNERMLADIDAGVRQAAIDSERAIASAQIAGQLMRQREALAFEGEQAGLGRAHQDYMERLGYGHDLGRLDRGYEQDIGRRAADAYFNTREYAERTGIDTRRQNVDFARDIIQFGLENPDLYGPEDVAGMLEYVGPILDQLSDEQWNSIFEDIFGG